MEIIKYKDFEGSVETDIKRNCCRGKILFIDDLVTYESDTLQGLHKQFEEAVDDYIETCLQVGKEPQKPFKGLFNVRIKPELHRAAVKKATYEVTSLNDVVSKALEKYLSEGKSEAGSLIVDLSNLKNIKHNTDKTFFLQASLNEAKKLNINEHYFDSTSTVFNNLTFISESSNAIQ